MYVNVTFTDFLTSDSYWNTLKLSFFSLHYFELTNTNDLRIIKTRDEINFANYMHFTLINLVTNSSPELYTNQYKL
jgi:hypothetical protein